MDPAPPVTDELVGALLKCRQKAYLKSHGVTGENVDYGRAQDRLLAGYRVLAAEVLSRQHQGEVVIDAPLSLPEAIGSGAALITNAAAADAVQSCRFDALERDGSSMPPTYKPVLFVRHKKVTAHDRMLLAFAASTLAQVQGTPMGTGKILHGGSIRTSRVELSTLMAPLRDAVRQVQDLAGATKPPPVVLNKHCGECEFRQRCRAETLAKDDLSLLRGLSAKEVASLNARGIFTVTQYSHTFRPGRLKRAAGKKHDHSLQALAIRENTVYIARRPELPDGKARLFLDVEGLPDEDFYYLVGLTVVEGGSRRHLSLWAASPAEEVSVWASFLEAVGTMEDFVLFHYGSYESKYMDRMAERHGGDAGVIARVRDRSVNVLSLVYAHVYFPAHANDLKSVAGCLGFRWSSPDASGLQAVAWRYDWEASHDPSIKQMLLTYNEDDCSALERVEGLLRSLGDGQQSPPGGSVPRVASVKEAPGPYRHQFGATGFALAEFAHLTKCAYFDYQRDKVLCRTSPRLRRVVHSKKRRKKQVWRVNREVEWGRPAACPHCGSTGFDTKFRQQKLVIDLKVISGGIRRQVTRHKTWRYQCRKCLGTFLPGDYLAIPPGYGQGLCGWVVYSTISLKQSNEAIAEVLSELFGVRFGRGYASRIRRRAVERYQPIYEALLASLRSGPLVHADETKVKMKGAAGHGYVWAFASPETAVYVYSPTRDGDTARDTLAGFKGILVSDFYAAYDSLDCPQQKCLIHLIRDFNDDLLRSPFDNDLRQQAGRFTALLQAVVATIDRYGLKKYHLHKHKRDVDRYYDAESKAEYESDLARHYQQRISKYRGKLFTFLDHDGVPWNNNNAENAIKKIASFRNVMRTPFTEAGIRDYLLLLSICQTLRYRHASFWQFLLSGETDLEAFLGNRR